MEAASERKNGAWAKAEMEHAIDHWRRQFRAHRKRHQCFRLGNRNKQSCALGAHRAMTAAAALRADNLGSLREEFLSCALRLPMSLLSAAVPVEL